MPIKFRPKETGKKLKEIIIKRITDPGNPYTRPKPIIELNKAFSEVMDQKLFNRVARKTINNNVIVNRVAKSKSGSLAANALAGFNKAKATILKGVEQTTGLPSIHGKVVKAENLSNPVNAAKKIGRKGKKVKSIMAELEQNPGGVARKAAGKTAEAPFATLGTVAGYVEVPVTGLYIPGTTGMALAGEGLLRQSKGYRKATSKVSNSIYNGRLGNLIENGVNRGRQLAYVVG